MGRCRCRSIEPSSCGRSGRSPDASVVMGVWSEDLGRHFDHHRKWKGTRSDSSQVAPCGSAIQLWQPFLTGLWRAIRQNSECIARWRRTLPECRVVELALPSRGAHVSQIPSRRHSLSAPSTPVAATDTPSLSSGTARSAGDAVMQHSLGAHGTAVPLLITNCTVQQSPMQPLAHRTQSLMQLALPNSAHHLAQQQDHSSSTRVIREVDHEATLLAGDGSALLSIGPSGKWR